MVIAEAQKSESLGDRIQSRSLGPLPQRVIGIRVVDDLLLARPEQSGALRWDLQTF